MKVNGIIAEYNPFHNGHRYQIEQAKRLTGADYTIIVLSGNFTQRGEPAIIDKFVRTRIALHNGADLVIELPVFHSAGSAEYFARGGVSILNQLGVVTHICFGSECGSIEPMREIAQIILDEPESYLEDLKSGQAAGLSYPAARNRALTDYYPKLAQNASLLTSPNNILGIEYMKALLSMKSSIEPVTILRFGSNYHTRFLESDFCSALALREAIWAGQNLSLLEPQMPDSAFEILCSSLKETPPIHLNDFSKMLLYKLLMEQDHGFDRFFDVTSDLSDRIKNNLKKFDGYHNFCELLKTKNMTHTRISRCLLHIMLDMKDVETTSRNHMDLVPYARVLGFRKEAAPLLSAIKKYSEIPLITKLADAESILNPQAYSTLVQDMRRSSVYESVAALKSGRSARDERQIPIEVIE
ncbi:MAG: nucleotidyltransferase [Lachnospiraceae bacterium]|nr:nucleotidyltransferase [Lachnospiraceae bacterium]